jgi:hypothetical protein
VRATAATRAAAHAAIDGVHDEGGTAIGRWLTLARDLMATRPDAIHHAVLLTDGANAELDEDMAAALAGCVGRFQCDCRGVGTDWRVDELRTVATTLLGTVDAVRRPDELVADFGRLVEAATSRATDRVSLRVRTPRAARVLFLREVAPTLRDLAGVALPGDALEVGYPTGAWGTETRDYHLGVDVSALDPRRAPGTEALAARVLLAVDGQAGRAVPVRAVWTTDDERASVVNPEVAHYARQAELAEALQSGLRARAAGDLATATLKLANGVRLARDTGNEATYRLLQELVHIDNPTTGTVRLKSNVDKIDAMVLDTRSTRTVRVNR